MHSISFCYQGTLVEAHRQNTSSTFGGSHGGSDALLKDTQKKYDQQTRERESKFCCPCMYSEHGSEVVCESRNSNCRGSFNPSCCSACDYFRHKYRSSASNQ